MDDLKFDPTRSSRANRGRPHGMFGSDHPPAKGVQTWLAREGTRKIDLENPAWETEPVTRIVDSYESYTVEMVKKMVKQRSSYDPDAKTTNAPALFTLDPFGKLLEAGKELRAGRAANDKDADVETDGATQRQAAKIDTWVKATSGPQKHFTKSEVPALELHCTITTSDLALVSELVRAYDAALCHNLYDVVDSKLGRLLNAERVKSLNLSTPTDFKWAEHKAKLYEQFKDTAEEDEILTFFHADREDNVNVALWVSERSSSRSLLEKDGVALKEKAWLAWTTHFISNDERTILKIPANRDMAAYDHGGGYKLTDLEEAVAQADPDSFKRFRTSSITNPLAKRVLAIKRAMKGSGTPGGRQPKSPSGNDTTDLSANQTDLETKNKGLLKKKGRGDDGRGKKPGQSKRTGCENPEDPSVLPQKDGKPDQSIYDKWDAGSLRRRLWDRMTATYPQCVRCGSSKHARAACTEERLPWEDDYEKGPSFWLPKSKRVQHSQHTGVVALCVPCVLSTLTEPATVGIDTLSSINTCLPSVALNSRSCAPTPVTGLGGTVHLDTKADLPVVRRDGTSALVECFVVGSENLPPHTHAILGLPAIQQLDISVDACLRNQRSLMPAATSNFAWNPFTVLLALFALAITTFVTSYPPLSSQQALLPGTALGHSLFDSLPEASGIFDIYDGSYPQCDPSDQHVTLTPLPHFSDPPETAEAQHHQSAFTGGRGMTAIIDIDVFGTFSSANISVGIDTLSDVNLAQREHLHDIQPISGDTVRGTGGVTSFHEQGDLHINIDGTVTKVPAFVATTDQLPRTCAAVLGIPGIDVMGIDLSAQLTADTRELQCYLGEKTLRAWCDANEGASVDTKPFNLDAIRINPELPPGIIARAKALISKYEDVFASSDGKLPKPFTTEPVELNFVSNARPQSIPEPRWTHALSKVISAWGRDGLANGSLEFSKSAWASRPHVVLKAPSGERAEDAAIADCKLRVCGDYRLVNTQIDKLTPNLPTGTVELEKASGHDYYFESDSVACYNSFTLAEGRSREALAVWTPLGLLQPTVLPFGQKNSGTEAQGPYRKAAASLTNLANYVDDWLGYSDSIEDLLRDFEKFLIVCRENNITLNVHKTRFGFSSADFFGFTCDKSGTRLAEKHLDPLANLVPPTDISELRRVLGLFQVSRKYFDHFAHLAKALTELTRGRKPQFDWGPRQQEAFEAIRDKLLSGVHLCPPRYDLPFHLSTDASDDGKGGVLYQLPSVPIEDQHPYDANHHCGDNMAVISYYSKLWPDPMRGRPPFYLEASALLWGMEKARFYALSSPFPLYTYSDHAPLQWINKTAKGAVSSFIIESLSDLETVHQYVPGSSSFMCVPDSASRYPMLGPKRLAPRGLRHSVQELLDRLPASLKTAIKVQSYAGEDSPDLARAIQNWRTAAGSVITAAPLATKPPPPVDLAILIPRPDLTPLALAQYLCSSIPFAILMPIDLVSQSYSAGLFQSNPTPGTPETLRIALKACGKLTFFETQMTWIVGNVPSFNFSEMFAAEIVTPAPLLESFNQEFLAGIPASLEQWIADQSDDPDFPAFLESIENVASRQGLMIYAPDNELPKILVPDRTREPLVRTTHEAMYHLGSAKVAAALSQSYYWPSLAADCRRFLKDCAGCELGKARRNEAHAMFTASPSTAPRSRLCMDFQGQGKALTGESEALAIIDASARYVVVIPLHDRTATSFIPKFLDQVVFRQGPPEILHSDAAQEFLSESLELLAASAHIETTTTLGHNAAGNSLVEIFWRYWNRALRILPEDMYKRWPELASRICFAYNTAAHSSLGNVSPFEIYHGVPARSPFAPLIPPADMDAELPSVDVTDPAAFATSVATSVAAFTAMATNHADYEKSTTAERLNQRGRPRSYSVGDRVKIYVPPTHEQMLASGRRAKHLLAWRGPCLIVEALSTTTYAMNEESTGRRFERAVVNILPYRASESPDPPSYDPFYSSPFQRDEIIAVRDEPDGPFYLAETLEITATTIKVHYHGCKTPNRVFDLGKAKFFPCWHLPDSNDVVLAPTAPPRHIAYTGSIEIESLQQLLVARSLLYTTQSKLRAKSRRAIAPKLEQLFLF